MDGRQAARGTWIPLLVSLQAVIIPFAQQEIVHTFLRGIDEDLAAHMRESTGLRALGIGQEQKQ